VLTALAVMTLGVAAFIYVYLPETKGKSLEEMLQYFADITSDEPPSTLLPAATLRAGSPKEALEAVAPMRLDGAGSENSDRTLCPAQSDPCANAP
jgi:hypothetical protein